MPPTPKDLADRRRKNLKEFMKYWNLKPAEWSRRAGVSSSAIYNFLNGASDSLSQSTLEKLASEARVPVSHLTGDIGIAESQTTISYVSIGFQIGDETAPVDPDAFRSIENRTHIAVPVKKDDAPVTIGGVMVGSSMNRIYPDGSILVVVVYRNYGRAPKDGDLMLVLWSRNGVNRFLAGQYRLDEKGRPWLWRLSDQPQFQSPVPLDASCRSGTAFADDTLEPRCIIIGGYRRERYAEQPFDMKSHDNVISD